MSCPSSTYSGRDDTQQFWTNWSGQVSGVVERLFVPDSLPDLVNIVQRATQENHELRVFGSGWAFEDLAFTSQWLINLERLNKPLTQVIDNALNDGWRQRVASGSQDTLFHVEAGIKIAALNELLAASGLALPTLGGASGQGLAGAISTGTHGCDINQPPLPDLVMAMHLVSVDGQEYWIERESSPITEDFALSQVIDCAEARIVRDDEIFNALLVSVGRFGIIYSYVLKVTRTFRLAEWTVKLPKEKLIEKLREGVAAGNFLIPLLNILPEPPASLGAIDVANPRALEVVFETQNFNSCWVKRRWLTNQPENLNHEFVEDELCRLGARGVLDKAKPILLAGTIGGLLVVPLVGPFWAALVGTKIIWLEDRLRENPGMSAGEMLALILRVTWDIGAGALIPNVSADAFAQRYMASLRGKRGPSHEIISGFTQGSQQTCYRAASIEPIFDAHQEGYINFLDQVITSAPNSKQSGYISLRWSATSKATLSMHNYDSAHAVAIEVTSLQGLPDTDAWINQLMWFSFVYQGRPHWGQQNSFFEFKFPRFPQTVKTTVPEIYGENLNRWRRALTNMVGAGTVFSCNFTRQRQLEPIGPSEPTLIGRKVGDVAASVLIPIQLLLAED
jgi:FAD binding domain